MKEILDSGCIDSVKIEGRTKTSYYAAITAKTYSKAIDDYYHDTFNHKAYQTELATLQNRGFTDAYLVNRPFEKHDAQNLDFTIMMGTHQVSGIVIPDDNSDTSTSGSHFLCKYKTLPGDEVEIVAPHGTKIECSENEFGEVYEKEGTFFMRFKMLVAQNKKVWEEVHSGNVNPIKLPITLPQYTFLRIPATDEMSQVPKK
jgi:putative protease